MDKTYTYRRMKAQINVHGEVYDHCLYVVCIVDRAKHVRFTSCIKCVIRIVYVNACDA
jgi:hypothetical protein